MARSGCLKDGCFQNLQVEGKTQLNGGSFKTSSFYKLQ